MQRPSRSSSGRMQRHRYTFTPFGSAQTSTLAKPRALLPKHCILCTAMEYALCRAQRNIHVAVVRHTLPSALQAKQAADAVKQTAQKAGDGVAAAAELVCTSTGCMCLLPVESFRWSATPLCARRQTQRLELAPSASSCSWYTAAHSIDSAGGCARRRSRTHQKRGRGSRTGGTTAPAGQRRLPKRLRSRRVACLAVRRHSVVFQSITGQCSAIFTSTAFWTIVTTMCASAC